MNRGDEMELSAVWLVSISLFIFLGGALFSMYYVNTHQQQSSIKRTHPFLGWMRYVFEKIGPELRQYFFLNDREARPVDRNTQETIAKAGKYGNTVIGFGSTKDFSKPDFLLVNGMYAKNKEELHVDNAPNIRTYTYNVLHDGLLSRKEVRDKSEKEPWYLRKEEAIIIGKGTPHPFVTKGLIGISAMSFGALSSHAIQALVQGAAISGGSWVNTGEGGISPYHLSKVYAVTDLVPEEENDVRLYTFVKQHQYASSFELISHFQPVSELELLQLESHPIIQTAESLVRKGYLKKYETPLIFQIGSGLFGARDEKGEFSEEVFLENALRPEVKVIEIKLAQGAKTRGGKLPAVKNTPFVAAIRGVAPHVTVESPNRFSLFHDHASLLSFIKKLRVLSGKPVGVKIVASDKEVIREWVSCMCEMEIYPDFVTIDGGEGGTGATYQEMADSLGLTIFSAIPIVDDVLREYNIRDRVTLIASGMLATADKMAIALSLGADLINVARGAMNTIGCINALKCNTNECPSGVATHKPHLVQGLVVEEKRFRTANYLATMREGLFMLGAACGISSPVEFERRHVVFRYSDSRAQRGDVLFPYPDVKKGS